jgi:hypothetical protein
MINDQWLMINDSSVFKWTIVYAKSAIYYVNNYQILIKNEMKIPNIWSAIVKEKRKSKQKKRS